MDWIRVLFVALFMVVCFVKGAPQQPNPDADAKIISQTNEINPDGSYENSFETDNGIKAQETGTPVKGTGKDDEDSFQANGGFSYKDKEGNQIALTYVADGQGGFQPKGDHLPTTPPIPPLIQRALDWIAQQPSTTERQGRAK